MIQSDIRKVLNVWKTGNKIANPGKAEFFLHSIEHMADYFAAGSYYYYLLDFYKLEIEMVHKNIENILGFNAGDFTINKLLTIMHPADLEKVHEKEAKAVDFLLNRIPKEEIPFYKVVYLIRLRHVSGAYKTILHQGVSLMVSHEGRIQKMLVVHTDVTYLNIEVDHTISFISNKQPSSLRFVKKGDLDHIKTISKERFTPRELEVIQKFAEGKGLGIIASELFISPQTAKTHKRNILRKSECHNITELVAKCIRNGVL